MRRRATFAMPGALVLGAARTALGQTTSKTYRLGVLTANTEGDPGFIRRMEALLQGLRELGYVEGRNLQVVYRFAGGRLERLPELAEGLVRENVDVIVTSATPSTYAAKQATRSIPIVMTSVGNAVEAGILTSLARPDANVTGITFLAPQLSAKRLELLRETLPHIRQVAFITNTDNRRGSAPIVQAMTAAARSLEIGFRAFGLARAADLDSVFDAIVLGRMDAVAVGDDTLFTANDERIALLAARHGLPSIGFTEYALAGGLMAYGVDRHAMYRRTAHFVHKVLSGTRPGELPAEQPTHFELTLNMKTATALGIRFSNAVLLRADRVIE